MPTQALAYQKPQSFPLSGTQTGRPGASQTRHPRGPRYVTCELMPQGIVASVSPRGAPILILFTNPQQPRFGMGLTSYGQPATSAFLPGQGPIDRGY